MLNNLSIVILSSPRRAGGSTKGDWSPFEAAPPKAGKSASAETLAALSGSGLPPGIWVQGFAPPSAFGRAAASPQTRQMRCWPSSERTTNPSSRRKRQDSLSLPLVLCPPKPLRWVSAGVLLGEMIKAPVFIFSAFPCGGWYHYPRRALHAVETLDAQELRRLICRFYATAVLALCGLNIPSADTHATPAPNRAHSGSRGETRGVFTA